MTSLPQRKHLIQVAPECPRFVNYLRVRAITGDKISFDVGGLSDIDAARLWDDWKEGWIAHVKRRREDLEACDGPFP